MHQRLEKRLFKVLVDSWDADAVNDVSGEGINQQIASVGSADASRAQIKQRFLVKLTDRSAMRTAHVISEDLKFGFRVDRRVFGKHEILVGLLGIRFLCILAHKNLAVKHCAGGPVKNAFIKLVTCSMRRSVIKRGVIIHMLFAADEIES